MLAAPLVAEAQQAAKVYRVCFLALTPGEETMSMKPLLERLHELGYGEGKNMAFEYRSAEGRPERLPQLAMELVRGRPDVLTPRASFNLADRLSDGDSLLGYRRCVPGRRSRTPSRASSVAPLGNPLCHASNAILAMRCPCAVAVPMPSPSAST
jgi:hypothetical protein